jgi:hypothetical protein
LAHLRINFAGEFAFVILNCQIFGSTQVPPTHFKKSAPKAAVNPANTARLAQIGRPA